MNKLIIRTIMLLGIAVCACNQQQKRPIHLKKPIHEISVSSSFSSKIIGKKLLYDFNTSYYEITVKNDSILNWRCVAGQGKGNTEDVRYYRHDVGKNIIMISWIDKKQRNISQTLNFNTDSVKTFVQLKDKVYSASGRIQVVNQPRPEMLNAITKN